MVDPSELCITGMLAKDGASSSLSVRSTASLRVAVGGSVGWSLTGSTVVCINGRSGGGALLEMTGSPVEHRCWGVSSDLLLLLESLLFLDVSLSKDDSDMHKHC